MTARLGNRPVRPVRGTRAEAGPPVADDDGPPQLPRAADLPTMSMAVRPASAQDATVTVGVVIDLPQPFAEQLSEWRREFGDPLAGAMPAHVTLLPPTEVSPEIGPAVSRHLAEVAQGAHPFRVRLCGTSSFRPVSPVVFVVLEEGRDGCDLLQKAIRTGPLHRELAYPFHPHVTVAQHLTDTAMDRAQDTLRDYTAEFTVDGVGLYEHGQDGVWRLRRRFAFGGG
jgi:2'-5' RNA ligase